MTPSPSLSLLALLAACSASTRSSTDAAVDVRGSAVDVPAIVDTALDAALAPSCTPSNPSGPSTTYDYVINTLTIDDNIDFNQPHTGFNVDNAWSPPHPGLGAPDCDHQDFFSVLDPDQNQPGSICVPGMPNGGPSCHGGVDNQLPELAQTLAATGTSVGPLWQREIDDGTLTLLVRVANVDGVPGPGFNDCNVNVSVFIGHPLASDCSAQFSGGSAFAVDNASLNTPGDLASARYQYTGQILDGRLRVSPGGAGGNAFPLALPPILGVSVVFEIQQFQLRASMTPTDGSAGNLGGYLLQSELSAIINEIAPPSGSIVGSVIGGLADVATSSPLNCGNTPWDGGFNPNGGIGFGMGFTMVRAVISPTTVSSAPPGSCGTVDGGVQYDAGCPDGSSQCDASAAAG